MNWRLENWFFHCYRNNDCQDIISVPNAEIIVGKSHSRCNDNDKSIIPAPTGDQTAVVQL